MNIGLMIRSWSCALRRHPRKKVPRSDGETVYICEPCRLEYTSP